MRILEEIKAHPYITAGVVVGGIGLIYVVASSGSGGAASAAVGGTSDAVAQAQISAEAQLQSLSLQAGVANTQAADTLAATQDTNASAVTVNKQNTDAAISVNNTNQSYAYQTVVNNNSTAISEAQLQADTAATINAQNIAGALSAQQEQDHTTYVSNAQAYQTDQLNNQAALEGMIVQGIAANAPITTTSKDTGFNFFGLSIGGGSSTSVSANPTATTLANLLSQVQG